MKLKDLRKQKNMSQQKLADMLGVSRSTVAMWEISTNEPDNDTLSRLADLFGVTVDYLLGRDDSPSPSAFSDIPGVRQIQKRKIPVLGEIACGQPIFADEQRDVYVSVTDELVCDYALIAKGDSMLPRIHDGDLVFIREMPTVPNGRIAAVLIEDEATLKRVFFDAEKQQLTLIAENTAYPPFVYIGEDLMNIRILGLAVAAQTRL